MYAIHVFLVLGVFELTSLKGAEKIRFGRFDIEDSRVKTFLV